MVMTHRRDVGIKLHFKKVHYIGSGLFRRRSFLRGLFRSRVFHRAHFVAGHFAAGLFNRGSFRRVP
jgi:hypothetical protein